MKNSYFLQNINRNGRVGAIVGFGASISGIALWIVLIYFNPYAGGIIAKDVFSRTLLGLLSPAIIGMIGSAVRIKWLMYAVFIVSLPLSLYLAGTPGIFKYFFLVSLGYLLSAVLITMGKKNKA